MLEVLKWQAIKKKWDIDYTKTITVYDQRVWSHVDDLASGQDEEGREDRFKYITIDMSHFGNYGSEDPVLVQTRPQLSFNGNFITSISVSIDKNYKNDNGQTDHLMKISLKSPSLCDFNVPIPVVEPVDVSEHFEKFENTFSEATAASFALEEHKDEKISDRLNVIINSDQGDFVAHTKIDFYYDGDYPRRDPKVYMIYNISKFLNLEEKIKFGLEGLQQRYFEFIYNFGFKNKTFGA